MFEKRDWMKSFRNIHKRQVKENKKLENLSNIKYCKSCNYKRKL